ncbi:hypothetical protein CEXT_180891 [Caerostris extrusa]|uniref:Uncharacterized protein n=1 Tax=Caerostris extrusa TaxID=172846 RepID=A0AAV4X9N2_CAEEX|nr:hypothetical protein CEXT_180891 [Caerostris extrusa]
MNRVPCELFHPKYFQPFWSFLFPSSTATIFSFPFPHLPPRRSRPAATLLRKMYETISDSLHSSSLDGWRGKCYLSRCRPGDITETVREPRFWREKRVFFFLGLSALFR